MPHLACAFALLVGLAVLGLEPRTAEAATYYVATSGNDANPGAESSPFRNPQACVDAMSAGDTCIVQPGTYTSGVAISGKSGTQTNPITIRAANPAVVCADPVNDPDGCAISTAPRSIFPNNGAFSFSGGNADWWVVEGFELRGRNAINCVGNNPTSGPNNNVARFLHSWEETARGGQGILNNFEFCTDFTYEHSYCFNPFNDDRGPDYCVRLIRGADGFVMNNVYVGGGFHYAIAVRNFAKNTTIRRLVCEGIDNMCISAGQVWDHTAISSPVQCNGVLLSDGSIGTTWDETNENLTIRGMFARDASGFFSRYGINILNVRNLDAEGLFIANMDWPDGSATGLLTNVFEAQAPYGQCGLEPGNNLVRGLIIVNPEPGRPCMHLRGNGYGPGGITIENFVCHDASAVGVLVQGQPSLPGQKTTAAPEITLRNGVFNDCTGTWSGQAAASAFTESNNNRFNCGSIEVANTDDPQFVGPESVPTPTLDSAYFAGGEELWNWEERYLPIISRFATQQPSLVDAGFGSAPPCVGTCDIGANEFFEAEIVIPPGVWESCAVYGNGDQVFGPFTNPWIDGRTGLVVDVDCAQKRIVIGRCDDPNDEATCDPDIYIHKAAQLRKRRVNDPITLNAGTAGSDADTSGVCWRTRATFDFTESLDELTGIWVRYEVDPDGGTHTCSAAAPDTEEWSFQGAEEQGSLIKPVEAMCFAESGLDTVKVSSTAELASAVAAAPAGRHILVSDGTYTASTLTLSANASLRNPIVIRPLNNPGDVILRNADWVIEGVGLVLDKLYFENAHLTFGNVDGGYKAAAYVRVTRGKFTSVDQTPFRLEAVTSIRIDHNDLSGRGDGVFRLIDMRHTEVIAGTQCGVLIDHNYIHDMAPTTGGNGSELIGTSSGDAGPYDPELSILYNLFDTITIPGEGEVFSAKLRGAHVEGNTFDGVALYLTAARQGASWEVRSNWWENSGRGGNGPLIGHGEDHLFIGNHIEGTINEIEIHGGDYLGSVGGYCQSCGYAACENCRVVGNDIEGDLEIGTHFGGEMNSQAATGTNNYGNTINGTVVLDNETGTTTKTEKTAYTAAVKLTPGSVGLLAADPLCD